MWSSSRSHVQCNDTFLLAHEGSQPVHAFWSKVISIIFCVLPLHPWLDVSSSKAVVDRTWILGGSLQDINHSNVIGRYARTNSPSTCRSWQPTQLTFHPYTKQLVACHQLGIGSMHRYLFSFMYSTLILLLNNPAMKEQLHFPHSLSPNYTTLIHNENSTTGASVS